MLGTPYLSNYNSMLTSRHSIWIGQAQAIFNSQELCAQAGENTELRVLYFHLACLLKLPVTAVFVFDGLKRPAVKRGKQVKPKPHWLTRGLKALVAAFGFHSHQVIYSSRFHLLLLIYVYIGSWRG